MKLRSVSAILASGTLAWSLLAASAWAQQFTMKIAEGPGPLENNYGHVPLQEFVKEVEQKSGGRIKVNIHWNFALGKNEAVMNRLRTGQVEAILTSEGHLAPYYPDVQVLGVPYLFADRKVAYEVLDGPFGTKLGQDITAKTGIRVMGWGENGGYRHYSSNKPMKTADDLKGLKLRTMTNPIHMQIVRSLGASPTPISWADLYSSLQTGVVDGQENSLATFRIPKLEEVQKNIILDGHVYSVLGWYVSEKFYQSLPPDLQKIVTDASKTLIKRNREISVAQESEDRKYLASKGVTVVDVSLSEKKRFQELTQAPAIETLKKEVNAKLLEELMAAVKAAEAKTN
ncbi:MAG: TRAP transporter substrate-binding protein [Bradyrhizobium sp.]|uniref:TRAP transporter substrate-binding protein n=1 Tax=Bradyrhizobium sp. TaxID=376 RepID=UPI002A26FA4A|nr:DctP family TRAP transporter solute-binding subunit [Bradyrhizobium sp.]